MHFAEHFVGRYSIPVADLAFLVHASMAKEARLLLRQWDLLDEGM
jgi:hypothetical protein